MAVVPIRIVGDPVLHTPTTPVQVAADGSLPADLAGLIATLYDTMDAAHGVGLAANQIGYGLRLFVYDCSDDRGLTDRRRGVVINPVLETSEIPETMPDPDTTTRVACRSPASRSPPDARSGRGSPASTPTAIRSISRAPTCLPACCSTKAGTWMVSCTWTASSAGTPAPPNGPSSHTAGAFPDCRGCRRGTRPVRSLMVSWPEVDTGDGSVPSARRVGPAAYRCGGAPAGCRSGGSGTHEDGRGGRVRTRRRSRAAGVDRHPVRTARSARLSMRPPQTGPALNRPGWTAGCSAPGTGPHSKPIQRCRWIFRLTLIPSPLSSPGTRVAT